MDEPITRRDVADAVSRSAQHELIGCGCIGIIAVIAVVALIVVGAANAPDLSKTFPTKSNSPKTVTIKVSGTAGLPYSGTYGSASTGQRSVEGRAGPKAQYSIQSTQSFDTVAGTFQKQQAQGKLKVDIVVDGQTVKSQETSASYGVVSVTHSL